MTVVGHVVEGDWYRRAVIRAILAKGNSVVSGVLWVHRIPSFSAGGEPGFFRFNLWSESQVRLSVQVFFARDFQSRLRVFPTYHVKWLSNRPRTRRKVFHVSRRRQRTFSFRLLDHLGNGEPKLSLPNIGVNLTIDRRRRGPNLFQVLPFFHLRGFRDLSSSRNGENVPSNFRLFREPYHGVRTSNGERSRFYFPIPRGRRSYPIPITMHPPRSKGCHAFHGEGPLFYPLKAANVRRGWGERLVFSPRTFRPRIAHSSLPILSPSPTTLRHHPSKHQGVRLANSRGLFLAKKGHREAAILPAQGPFFPKLLLSFRGSLLFRPLRGFRCQVLSSTLFCQGRCFLEVYPSSFPQV